jgi:Leucine-rich repeat (LRR) protein
MNWYGGPSPVVFGNLADFLADPNHPFVTHINVPAIQSLVPVPITTVTGLASLPNLVHFGSGQAELVSVDLSQNGKLEELDLITNDTSLALVDVRGCPLLSYLDCTSAVNNPNAVGILASLDVTHNPLLAELYCGRHVLTVLDLSQNPALKFLDCSFNKISSLDVRGKLHLQRVDAQNNAMDTAAVDKILCDMQANAQAGTYDHQFGRVIHLQNNAPPSSAGIACAQALIAAGWGVFHD